MRRVFLIVLGFLGVIMTAQAEPYSKVSADQLKATFFGIEMIGETARSGIPWMQCIAADGSSVSKFEGRKEAGKLVITDDARACFMTDAGPRCFDVYKSGQTYLLTGRTEFKVKTITSGIGTCS